MIVRLWTTLVQPGRESDYLQFANSRSRDMFLAAPGCLGVLFLDVGNGRHAACTFWNDAEAIEAFTASSSYQETVAALRATGSLGEEQSILISLVEGGFLNSAELSEELRRAGKKIEAN